MSNPILDRINAGVNTTPNRQSADLRSALETLANSRQNAVNALRYTPSEQSNPILDRINGISRGESKPGGFAGVFANIVNAPGIKQFLKPLEILDVPRRVVLSTAKEFVDLAQGDGFSWDDWTKQTKDPTFGVGRYVDTGSKWLDRFLGFVGDVALDPMTYVGFGASKLASAGERVAAGGRLVNAGTDAMRAARVAREGSWFLTQAEREAAGLKRAGVYFMGKRIAGTGKAGEYGQRALAKTRIAIGDSSLGEMFRKAFTPADAKQARLALARGQVPSSATAKQYFDVILSRDAMTAARNVARQSAARGLEQVANSVEGKTLRGAGRELTEMLANPALAARASAEQQTVLQKMRAWFNQLRDDVDEASRKLTGDGVGDLDDYVPLMMTPGAKGYATGDEALRTALGATADEMKRVGVFRTRKLKEGSTFFGQVLGKDDITPKRLNEIARAGGFKGDFFEEDIFKLAGAYSAQYSAEMGRLARWQYLADKGTIEAVQSRMVPDLDAVKVAADAVAVPAKQAAQAGADARAALNAVVNHLRKTVDDSVKVGTGAMVGADAAVLSAEKVAGVAGQKLTAAREALASAETALGGLFDEGGANFADLFLIEQLGQQMRDLQDEIVRIQDEGFAAVNQSIDVQARIPELQNQLKNMEDFVASVDMQIATLEKTLKNVFMLQEFINSNLDNILRGNLDNIVEVGALKEIPVGITTAAEGVPFKTGKAMGSTENAVRAALAADDEWGRQFTGASIFGGASFVSKMTNEGRQAAMNKAGRMEANIQELADIIVALTTRNEVFWRRMGIEKPEQLVALERELLGVVSPGSQGKLQGGILSDLVDRAGRIKKARLAASKPSGKMAFREGQKDVILRQLYNDAEAHTAGLKELEQLNLELLQKTFSSTSNADEILQLKEKIALVEKRILEVENVEYYVGFGATKKRYDIFSIDELEQLTYTTEDVIAGGTRASVAQQRNAYKAGVEASASTQLRQKAAVAIEQYYLASEIWMRATAMEEALGSLGLSANDNVLRVIARTILEERKGVWRGRWNELNQADASLAVLEREYASALESGNFEKFNEWKAALFNDKVTPLARVLGTTSEKLSPKQRQLQDLLAQLDEDRRALARFEKTQSSTEAYDVLAQRRESEAVGRTRGDAFVEDLSPVLGEAENILQDKEMLTQRVLMSHEAIITYYQQVIGPMPPKSFKYSPKYQSRILTKQGAAHVRSKLKGSELLEDSATANKRLLEEARKSISDEIDVVRRVQRSFGNLDDPDVDVMLGLKLGGQGFTPFKLSEFYIKTAERIRSSLEVYAGARTTARELQTQVDEVQRLRKLRIAEYNASLTGREPDAFVEYVEIPVFPGREREVSRKAINESVARINEFRLRIEKYSPILNEFGNPALDSEGKVIKRGNASLKQYWEDQLAKEEAYYERLVGLRTVSYQEQAEAARFRALSPYAAKVNPEDMPDNWKKLNGQLEELEKNLADAEAKIVSFKNNKTALKGWTGKRDNLTRKIKSVRRQMNEIESSMTTRVNLAEVIDDRFAANQRLADLKGTDGYAQAEAARERYEELALLADRDLSGIDFVAAIDDSLAGTRPDLVFTREEWLSLFAHDASKASLRRAEEALAAETTLERSLRIKKGKALKAGNQMAADLFQAQLDQVVANRIWYEYMTIALQKETRQKAIEKWVAVNQMLEELATARRLNPDAVKNKVFTGKVEWFGGIEPERVKSMLESGWLASPEKRLLDKVDEVANSVPVQSTLNVAEEMFALSNRLYGVGGTEEAPKRFSLVEKATRAQAERDAAFADARAAASEVDRMAAGGERAGFPYSVTGDLAGTAGARISPTGLADLAEELQIRGQRGVATAERRSRAQRAGTVLSEQNKAKVAQLEELRAQKELGYVRGALEEFRTYVKDYARLWRDYTPSTVQKRYQTGIKQIETELYGKGAKKTGGISGRLAAAKERVFERYRAGMDAVEKAVATEAEAGIAFDSAIKGIDDALYVQAVTRELYQENVEAAQEFLGSLPVKPAKGQKVPPPTYQEVLDMVERAKPLLESLRGAPDDVLANLWAKAEIANMNLFIAGRELEDAQWKQLAAEYSTNVVVDIRDGWYRLGGYSEAELAQLKTARKQAKGKQAKGALKPKPVFDASMPNLQAPAEVVQMFDALDNAFATKASANAVWDFVGKYTNFFKAYATLSPGFHLRNAISNVVQVLAAGAKLKNIKRAQELWKLYVQNPDTWLDGLRASERKLAEDALQAMMASGGGRIDDAFLEFALSGSNRIYNNWLTNASQKFGHKVESAHRFWLAYDSVVDGLDMNQASARVRRFLVDYSNPSAADEALRKIVPFWTWMSRNFPLQLVNRWTNPRVYSIYNSFQRNIGGDTEGMMIPQSMQELGAMRLGGSAFLQPDLPWTRMNQQIAELGQPNRLLSYVNPLLRVPFELAGNTKLYSNQPFTDRPQELGGIASALTPLLALLGQTQTDASGKTVTNEKALYALMNLIPPLSTAERLFPSTEQYQQRRGSSALSWLGIPVRTLTDEAQTREAYRRNALLQQLMQQQRYLGKAE